ncbi:MAG: adenosylcobinamide-GDP ribazoletransferase [Bacteroidales bacterium]|nr:adenosylcobinamide-GDP ribazoletransferase [Bacteroidales bacterium]
MKKALKRELNLFLNALMFFTRIPCPRNLVYSEEIMCKALRYYPLTGLIVAAITAGILWLALLAMPVPVAVILALAASVLLTGAFHEDGLADFVDGFGGGYTRERILEIMRDSCIGTFGTIALILLFALKIAALITIPEGKLPAVLISAGCSSRVFLVLMVKTSSYARENDGKAFFSRHGIGLKSLGIIIVSGFIPLIMFNYRFVILYIALALIFLAAFRHYLHRRIGGFTGDTLGAVQQITELIFYILLTAGPPSWMNSSAW